MFVEQKKCPIIVHNLLTRVARFAFVFSKQKLQITELKCIYACRAWCNKIQILKLLMYQSILF